MLSRLRRAAKRPEAECFQDSLNSEVITARVQRHDGTLTSPAQFYAPEKERLARTIGRIARGLYYHHREEVVPVTYRASGGLLEDFAGLEKWLLAAVAQGDGHGQIASGAFEYFWGPAADDPFASIWWLSFYDASNFVGIIAPQRVSLTSA